MNYSKYTAGTPFITKMLKKIFITYQKSKNN